MNREVICDDANLWLRENKGHKIIITSLPDMEETGMEYEEWVIWIGEMCKLLMQSLDKTGVIFFYQTDRKYKGAIIDKKALISRPFLYAGFNTIMSKIVLKQEPETVNLFRPTFTNLFGYSKTQKTGRSTPDVIHAGKMIYKNAMGMNAVNTCIEYLKQKQITGTIVDPFCGMGSVLKIANDNGFDAVGVDILLEQVKKAEAL